MSKLWDERGISPTIREDSQSERPPAVYAEMMRLPEGVWLPHLIRINGGDYQTLFDGIITDNISTFSNFIRFSTGIKDVKVNEPPN